MSYTNLYMSRSILCGSRASGLLRESESTSKPTLRVRVFVTWQLWARLVLSYDQAPLLCTYGARRGRCSPLSSATTDGAGTFTATELVPLLPRSWHLYCHDNLSATGWPTDRPDQRACNWLLPTTGTYPHTHIQVAEPEMLLTTLLEVLWESHRHALLMGCA